MQPKTETLPIAQGLTLLYLKSNTGSYLTADFKALPALNAGYLDCGKVIFSKVLGLIPSLDSLVRTSNLPKPVKSTESPLASDPLTAPKKDSTAAAACFLVKPASSATLLTISFFNIKSVLLSLEIEFRIQRRYSVCKLNQINLKVNMCYIYRVLEHKLIFLQLLGFITHNVRK